MEERSVLHRREPFVASPDDEVDRDELRRMATVTVLVAEPPLPAHADWFDVCVGADEVDAVAGAVRAHPLASLGLVALLRTGVMSDVWAGLAAEAATYSALLGGDDYRSWLAQQGQRVDRRTAVRVERTGDELRITLDRPEVHNAFNRAMRDGLVEALALAATDPSIAHVRLSGAGPSFSSGGDRREFGTVADPPTALAVRLTRHPGWWMHVCAPRVTAHVHGACIGAGIELAAFAGRVEASTDAFFSLPELGMGLIPGAGGTVSMTRRIGRQRVAWMAITGARIDVETALRWGLIDAITPAAATGR